MATNELIEKLKEIVVHVGLAGEYKPGYDIVKNLRKTKCKKCIRLADELQVLESQAKEPSDEDIEIFYPSEVGQAVIMESNMTYDQTRLANYYRRQGAKAMRDGKIKTQTK